MNFTGKIAHKILPMKDCNAFEKMSFNTAKKIGILYPSFLSFRLYCENEIEVEKQSHSPPQNNYL